MLEQIRPVKAVLERTQFLPPVLAPLMSASAIGHGIEDAVVAIAHRLGFDNFMYGASISPRIDHESRSYVCTTLPRDWVARYDQRAYIEVDSRIARALDSALPLVWEYETERGHSGLFDAFLDDSLAHGVGSGLVLGLHGARGTSVIFALSNAAPRIDGTQRHTLLNNLGDCLLLAVHFHELFMKRIVEQGIAPRLQGSPLSPREKECLILAARGQTSRDIAFKLGISERTVQFHFDGIRSKLGAATRNEAVAKGIGEGIISVG